MFDSAKVPNLSQTFLFVCLATAKLNGRHDQKQQETQILFYSLTQLTEVVEIFIIHTIYDIDECLSKIKNHQ